ncbi:unnamed protein product [Effrenium voratum]|nr:unnamed protein product [Effrenium voratum]
MLKPKHGSRIPVRVLSYVMRCVLLLSLAHLAESQTQTCEANVSFVQKNLRLEEKRPNLLLLLLDQWRFDFTDESYMSSANRLAREGVRFSRAYTPSPMCSPARAALFAGREFTKMWVQSNAEFWYDEMPSPPLPTFINVLQDAGYATMVSGKDHLDRPPLKQKAVEQSGFDVSARMSDKYCTCLFPLPYKPIDEYGAYLRLAVRRINLVTFEFPRSGIPSHGPKTGSIASFVAFARQRLGLFEQNCQVHGIWGIGSACKPNVCDSTCTRDPECGFRCNRPSPLEANHSMDQWVGRSARKMLSDHRKRYGHGKPWFLQVSFLGPHPPFIVDTPYGNWELPSAFDDIFDEELVFPNGMLKRIPHRYKSQINVSESRAGYVELLKRIDVEIQQILELVEPERSNTVVVLSSDHGEHLGDHGFFGKESPMEVSIRIPMIISGPKMRKNAVEDGLVSLIDVGRTFIELAGAAVPSSMQSQSLLPALQGAKPLRREVVVTGLDFWESWLEDGTSLGRKQFQIAAGMFQGSFLKVICCPAGCRKQGSLLPSLDYTPQVALMNVTDGLGAARYEHNVLDMSSGFGVPEALQLLGHLGDTFQAACRPLLQ